MLSLNDTMYVQRSFWICTALIVKVIHLRLRMVFLNLSMRYDIVSICNCTHLTLKMGARIFCRMSSRAHRHIEQKTPNQDQHLPFLCECSCPVLFFF